MIMIFGTLVWIDVSRCITDQFFKILIFLVVRGVKEQKMVQNDKKFCLLHSVSQEPYIIWFSFLVHMCKMIIPSRDYFIFSKFWFFRLLGGGGRGGKRAKNGPKWQKILSVTLHIPWTKHHMIFIYGTHV